MKQFDNSKQMPLDENGLSECARHYLKHGPTFQTKESDRALDAFKRVRQQGGLSVLLENDPMD